MKGLISQIFERDALRSESGSAFAAETLGPMMPGGFLGKRRFLFGDTGSAGRQISFGFSYIQRVGHSAYTDLWFPKTCEESTALRIRNGDSSVLGEFKVEWAAVRQFELLREAGNSEVLPLDVTNIPLSMFFLSKIMRAGAQRVTVITMGTYTDQPQKDDLRVLDQNLQDTITRFISMLYLEEQSVAATEQLNSLCEQARWNYAETLPHVAMSLGETQMFSPLRTSKMKTRFFDLLGLIPQKDIRHDVAVGLQIPEATSTNSALYTPESEDRLHVFQQTLTNVFRNFDGMSLGQLHGRENASREVKATTGHMRGYGDHMRPDHAEPYRSMAQHLASYNY